jgi:hypothetical protein
MLLYHMRQIEQDPFTFWCCFEYGTKEMAASAGNIADNLEPREISRANNRRNLPLCFSQHRRVKDAVCLRECCMLVQRR